MTTADTSTFYRLAAVLAELDEHEGTGGNRLYYLATIPALFATVAGGLQERAAQRPRQRAAPRSPRRREALRQRPRVCAPARRRRCTAAFSEDQIFRIDHYMGKETVLNVLALRFANSIFEPIWNRRYVDHVQVTVAESLGVEHRGNFYETAGALRDIVQNHVMQVLSLTLMEPPPTMDATAIRDEKVKLLRSIVIPSVEEEVNYVVRGQYARGAIDGEEVAGYREEEGVDRALADRDLRRDVPQRRQLALGGRPDLRADRKAPASGRPRSRWSSSARPTSPSPGRLARDLRPDALTLRIQPDEGISLSFGAKVPGPAFRVRSVSMDFAYSETFPGETPDAYERLLLDAMIGDPCSSSEPTRSTRPGRSSRRSRRPSPRASRRSPATSRAAGGRRRPSASSSPTGTSGAIREAEKLAGERLVIGELRVVDSVPVAFAELVAEEMARSLAHRATTAQFRLGCSGGSSGAQCFAELARSTGSNGRS